MILLGVLYYKVRYASWELKPILSLSYMQNWIPLCQGFQISSLSRV